MHLFFQWVWHICHRHGSKIFPNTWNWEKKITICTIIFDYKNLFVILFLAFKVRLFGILSGVRQAAMKYPALDNWEE